MHGHPLDDGGFHEPADAEAACSFTAAMIVAWTFLNVESGLGL